MNDLSNLSIPLPAARDGEHETTQLALVRLRSSSGRTRWSSSSELQFPDPYAVVALEAHYEDLLGNERTTLQHESFLDATNQSSKMHVAIFQVSTGAWTVRCKFSSKEERLGRILVAYELMKEKTLMLEEFADRDRMPLEAFSRFDLHELVNGSEQVEFAYIMSTFEDSEGFPSGWSYRATSKPNRFELLGVLAVEIEELKEAIRDSGDDAG